MKIGVIAVVPAGTLNPYGRGLCGTERSRLLGRFLQGQETPGFEFWYAPVEGGARKLASAEEAAVDPEAVAYYWPEVKMARSSQGRKT